MSPVQRYALPPVACVTAAVPHRGMGAANAGNREARQRDHIGNVAAVEAGLQTEGSRPR